MATELTSRDEAFLQEFKAAPVALKQAILAKLSQRLANRPLSLEQFRAKRRKEAARSLGESAATFGDNFLTGAGAMAKEAGKAIGEITGGEAELMDVKRGLWDLGRHDFIRFAKTLGGAAQDKLGSFTPEEEEIREYRRYRENFDYYQKVRPTIIEATGTDAKAFVGMMGEFADPTLALPVAGLSLKGGAFAAKSARLAKASKALEKAGDIASLPSKATAALTRKGLKGAALVGSKLAGTTGKFGEVTAKAAGYPRRKLAQMAGGLVDEKAAGGALVGAQVIGAMQGAVPGLGLLTGTEIVGYLANKTGRSVERVLSALSQPSGQMRFLQRLAQTAESPRLRRLALFAHRKGGTWLGDRAFNMLVNGVSVGALNTALAVAAGEGAEGAGQAAGAGFVMGGMMPFGQPDQIAGKSQAARDAASISFLEAKWADDQLKTFREMPPEARLMFATAEEAGIPAPKITFLDADMFLERMRQDDPNARKAEDAFFDPIEKTIYLNRDGNMKKGSREAMDLLAHELGHHFITEAIKDDPFFARHILSGFEPKPGEKSHRFAFTRDASGDPIDFIDVNQKAKDIADAYSSISEDAAIGIGNDANKLAQEIGADQFAMMLVDQPNMFKAISPPLRHKLLDAGRRVLTLFGAAEPDTGNPLAITISPLAKRSPAIRKLYRNYVKHREWDMVAKTEMAERGQSLPVKKGETADQAVERMFGVRGLTLREMGAFRINDRQAKAELMKLRDRLIENPQGSLYVQRSKAGNPTAIVGKEIPKELRTILTNPDPRGTINAILNDSLEAIHNNLEVNYLYRSSKHSKYSDKELKVRVVRPVAIRIAGLRDRSSGPAKVLLDTFDMAYLRNNLEVLVREGFVDDPDALIDRARRVSDEAVANEGRINPKGEYENELVTALFGHPESAPDIRDGKLRRLLEDEKLQHSYRSYDLGALATLAPTGKSGIGFDWDNVKTNYSPMGKDFMPARRDETVPLPFIEDLGGEQPSAGFRRVATQKMRKADYERFQKPLSDAEMQEALGNQSQVQPFQPRFPRGDKLFMPAPAPDSKAFNEWYGKDSPRNEDGSPTLLYHGNVADIKSFDPSLANPEGDLGKAIYLTNSQRDVNANYASEAGPDLTIRIARRAEALEAEGLPPAEAEATARAESLDNLGNVMPVYASMEKAFKVGGPDETQFTFKWKLDKDGDIIGEEGTMIDLIEALSQASRKYDGNGEEAIAALMDFVADNGESIPASEAMRILKENDAFGYLSDDDGNLVSNEVIREAVQRLGFDGIADHTVYDKFGPGRKIGQPMQGIDENTVHYAVFKPEQVKSAFNRGTWDAGESNVLYMPSSDSPDLPYKVSTRNPTAVKAPENPLTSDLVIGLEAIEADPKMLHSHAFALQEYPGIKRTSRSPKVIAEKFIDHVVDNLLWLYDQVAPEVRERSRLWYDGARRIVDRWSEEFGTTRKTIGGTRSTAREKQGIAAALAALSPQKDWFMNVDLARRILDVMTFKKREKFDSAMVDKYIEKFSESLGRKEASKIANAMKGKTLEELPTNYEQAAFIRAYDEVYNPREYQIVSPEGEFIGISRKQNGEPDSVAWGSMSEIAKAVRVLRDPTHRNISEALGNAHKIRNFYNNILLPKADKLSVTIDTHAIAAALLRALAGADLEVANNFGTKPKGAKRSIKNSSVTGIQGTYGIYADAYRKAAEARGVLPREMQSITWEAIRGLFEAKWKTKGNKAKVDNLWKKYENGSLSLNETRQAILDLAEGIKDPEWVGRRSNRGTDESLGAPENAEQLPSSELGRQELQSKSRGRVSDARDVSPEVGRQFMPAGEGRSPAPRRAARPAPRGNRFMAPAAKRVAEEGPGRLFMPKAKEMVLYHGTNKKNLKNLKSSLTLDDQVKGVSLTPSFEEAKIYAQETAQRGGGDPVVYEVKGKAGNLIDHVELLRAIDPKDSGKDWTPAEVEAFLKKEGYSGIDYTSDPMLGYGIRMIDPKKLEIVRQELIDGG